jgi:hypothetical protein
VEQALMRRVALVGAACLALLATGSAGASGPMVSYTITSGTPGNNGWWRSVVTVTFSVSGATDSNCPVAKTFRTSSDAVDCTATDGTVTAQFHFQFKIDTDPPVVSSATPDRQPDGGGWYNHPVSVTFSGNDPTSGIASCTSATYSGPDSGSASVSGTCTDNAGNVSSAGSFGLRYDTTPPAVTASLSRPPDANGWYSHPVDVAFSGTDGGSGIASCTPTSTYSGPDSDQATITGACVDAAGNKASASTTLKYDTTPPKLAGVGVSVTSLSATLSWKAPSDTAAVAITRIPGRDGQRSTVVFRGLGSGFRDATLRPGTTYKYEVASSDAAGNTNTVDVAAVAPSLYLPAAGARVGPGQVLRWATVKGASYYNVQIYRGTQKVMSAWPTGPRLKLTRRWVYNGKTERLAPGHYRWYVWPGHGALKAAKYGRLIGGKTFVVR